MQREFVGRQRTKSTRVGEPGANSANQPEIPVTAVLFRDAFWRSIVTQAWKTQPRTVWKEEAPDHLENVRSSALVLTGPALRELFREMLKSRFPTTSYAYCA